MSLRAFHLVFVTVSTLLFAFLVLWAFVFGLEKSSVATTLGYVGVVGLLLMPVYGVYFLRKANRIHL